MRLSPLFSRLIPLRGPLSARLSLSFRTIMVMMLVPALVSIALMTGFSQLYYSFLSRAEKINALRAFGAQVHVCPTAVAPEDPRSYYETAKRIARETPHSYFVGQYFNTDNIEAHYRTTGPEIWRQTKGKIDVLVGGIGTGGTVSGTARYLKEQNPKVAVIAADPEGSVFYHYFKTGALPEAHPYLVEGIGDDFLCPTLDLTVIDDICQVSDRDCFLMARDLTRKEGICGGGSSGGIVLAALRYAQEADLAEDKLLVAILPDHGNKYISKIFNDEWMREKGFIE